jgi:hypothetical protein
MTTQAEHPTVEIAFAPAEIKRELIRWSENLIKAKGKGDLLAIDTAQRYLDTWLDRKLAAARAQG